MSGGPRRWHKHAARLRQALKRENSSLIWLESLDDLKVQIGSVASRLLQSTRISRLRDAEFTVFSQFGEDGIIQYLVQQLDIPPQATRFVECGVSDYRECNTRFLLVHNNWEGLIIDSKDAHLRFLERSPLRWKHTIEAVQTFITRDNLSLILEQAGFGDDIGLLSIDLDGNDYWVWDSLSGVSARIVVIEYNSVFGPTATVSVPYDPSFDRERAHPSCLYWGASLGALVHLATRKGYRFVGGNSAGNNAFFVRGDAAPAAPERTSQEEWVSSRFRESRGPLGQLDYATAHSKRRALIGDMPVVDVVTGEELRVRDLPSVP